ncbi:histidine kinase [Cupriavidus sp. CV2]|uniref:sensor histidine kinase n=1 Tax=Cupriavidus ulmosensis TaxID=3065913 RepID=UPI00296B229D|nr:ATP-binding protein [Cupriavidus sp. CV2]MDW3681534.1 histidine kinase [Cupriavidus sp. CV2]
MALLPILRLARTAALWLALCCVATACGGAREDSAQTSAAHATSQVQVLRQALAVVRPDDAGQGHAPQPVEVALPHDWDRIYPGRDGTATYRLDFPYSGAGQDLPALYLARAANSFEMHLNGKLLAASGALNAPAVYGGQRPLYIPVPEAMLRPDNTLTITIAARANARAGLSRIEFGPSRLVHPHYEGALWFRVIGPLVITALSLLLTAISLLIWWRQRDPLFGLYALAEVAWSVSVVERLLESAPLPLHIWQVLVLASRTVFIVATARFALIVIDVRSPWPARLVTGFLWLKIPLIVLMTGIFNAPSLKLFDWSINMLLACAIASALAWAALRRPSRERLVLAATVALASALSTADVIRIQFSNDFYWDTSLTKYVSQLFSLSMAWLLVDRYTRTTSTLAELNRNLDRKVAQKEEELHLLYAHSREIEREQATLRERGRIMRDMHDGLGSTLVGALSLLRSGHGSPMVLQQHLQQALDALKLSVDAMQDTGGDLAVVLGNLRYRLQARLEAARLRVDWQVERLPAVAGLTPQIVRELQYLLLEAFSNVMQHAGGATVQVVARSLADTAAGAEAILIEIRDDGCGFDAQSGAQGHGLANMRSRAAAIGGELSIASSERGTTVSLLLHPARWAEGEAA